MKRRLARLTSRLMVIAIVAAALVASRALPAYANPSACGTWYNACDNSCLSQEAACMAEYNDPVVCYSYVNQCRVQCQATFYECLSNQMDPPFCVYVGWPPLGEWVCI